MRHFNAKSDKGRIPLVLIPSYPVFFSFLMQVPSGVYVWSWRVSLFPLALALTSFG